LASVLQAGYVDARAIQSTAQRGTADDPPATHFDDPGESEQDERSNMKATAIVGVLVPILAGMAVAVAAPDETPKAPAQPAGRAADEKAIREAGAAFVHAYNAGDARAATALFTPDAEVVSEDGQVIQGQDDIARLFAMTFESHPGETLEIDDIAIRFLRPDVAKEEGRARIRHSEGKPAHEETAAQTASAGAGGGRTQASRYTVLYVRQDGRWLQSSVREHPDRERTPHERLEELQWLLGDWVDEGHGSVVRSITKWSDDGNYLLRDVTIHVAGKPALAVHQRIGWDPLTRQITSWVFDSEGGHGTGLWSRDGQRWVVKASGVLRDGRTATASQIYTVANPLQVRWKSVDRTIGDQLQPDDVEFVMVRQPPRPGSRVPR
jgi:uncharacterized protein (TIGR02246 family)